MTDHAMAAQRAAEEWLAELDECLYAEESEEEVEWPEKLLAPYDGCDTCRVRETLNAAYPHLEKMFREDQQEEP